VGSTLGREVCLRDGAIRALLTGRVEKLDHTYLLSTTLVNPVDGATVASFSEEAEGQKAVVSAVRRLANEVRETLGERLIAIQVSDEKLVKVTTPSLRALQLYSQADALMAKEGLHEQAPAAELLKQSLAEDPEFASAYITLAHSIRDQGGAKDEYLAHAERAWELAETTSERERYFIQASYYDLLGEGEKAAAAYQALLRVYPDDYWATGRLEPLYGPLNRFEDRMPYLLRLAELRPNSFAANVAAAQVLVRWRDDLAQAEPYLQRARALLSPEVEKRIGWGQHLAAWVRLFPAHTHWLQGDVERTLSEVTRVDETAKARRGPEREVLARWVAATYLTLGKLRAAEEIYLSFPDRPQRHTQLSLADLARGDEPAVMEHLHRAGPSSYKASHLVQAGLLGEAETVRQALPDRPLSRFFRACARAADQILRGELALARGETAEAVRLLEDVVGRVRRAPECPMSGSASLARALEEQGEWQRALRVLEETAQDRKAVYSSFYSGLIGLFWMNHQWQRAELLRKLGREPEAREIEAELRKLLAYADADHKILRGLRDLSQIEKMGLAQSAEEGPIASPKGL
jgi:tetratricopeptide (TPR) repeat protein